MVTLLIVLLAIGPTWYKTQEGTGIGNCGPACVAMVLEWGGRKTTVEEVRSWIGYQREDGATTWEELDSALDGWIRHRIEQVDILEVQVTQGPLIVLLDMSKIRSGKNHSYMGGHYVVISGVDMDSFIVQDPMPNGQDRRYKIHEVYSALKSTVIIQVYK